MWKSGSSFTPNSKTSGGYDTIYQHMLHHSLKLQAVQSRIDTTPPALSLKAKDQLLNKSNPSASSSSHSSNISNTSDLVEKTRKRVQELKQKVNKDSFCGPPKSAALITKLSENRRKRANHQDIEHARRLELMALKIKSGTMNRSQTTASLTKRPHSSSTSQLDPAKAAQSAAKQMALTLKSKRPQSASPYAHDAVAKQLDSAFDVQNYLHKMQETRVSREPQYTSVFPRDVSSASAAASNQPSLQLQNALAALRISLEEFLTSQADKPYNTYVQLKKLLVDCIVDQRIYKSADIYALFKICHEETRLDQTILQQVITELKEELSLS